VAQRVALLLALAVLALSGMPPALADTVGLTASVTMGGRETASADGPIRLSPNDSMDVAIELTNHGPDPVSIGRVELTGSVLGLNFFNYTTRVESTLPPGSTQTLRYRLDLTGLEGQATGLIGAELLLKDKANKTIASVPMVTDVRGSLLSVYGFFGIALIVLTLLAIVDVAIAVARHRLSENRWRRGLRLLVPGIGIGLVLGFSASVLRLWAPHTGTWLVIAGSTAAAFFVLGYFSPTPDSEDDEFDDDDELDFAAADLEADTVSADEYR
jgi:hypothetical protein